MNNILGGIILGGTISGYIYYKKINNIYNESRIEHDAYSRRLDKFWSEYWKDYWNDYYRKRQIRNAVKYTLNDYKPKPDAKGLELLVAIDTGPFYRPINDNETYDEVVRELKDKYKNIGGIKCYELKKDQWVKK